MESRDGEGEFGGSSQSESRVIRRLEPPFTGFSNSAGVVPHRTEESTKESGRGCGVEAV